MDDFDISSEGYTPERIPLNHEPYRPPRLDEDPFDLPGAKPRSPRGYNDDRRQPIDPSERRQEDLSERETFKGRPRPEEAQPAMQNPKADDTAADEGKAPIDTEEEKAEKRQRRIRQLRQERQENDRPIAIVRFFTDERTRFFLGATLIVISLFMLFAIVSHFAHGADDQSAVTNLTFEETANNPGSVKNVTGGFGAWLSHVLLCDGLGLGSLLLIPYMWILALALFGERKCNFWGTTFRTLLLAVATSIVLGFVTYNWSTQIYWGGDHGHYINKLLFDNATWIGAAAVSIILVAAVCCVYLNELRIVWNKWRATYKRHKLQEELRRERQRELERLEAEQELAELEASERQRREKAKQKKQANDTATDTDDDADDTTELKIDGQTDDTDSIEERLLLIDDDIDTATQKRHPYNPDGHTEGTNQKAETIDAELRPVDDPEALFAIDSIPASKDEETSGQTDFSVKSGEIAEADPEAPKPEPVKPGEYNHRDELPHYIFPTVDLLEDRPSGAVINMEEQQANKEQIERTLLQYKIPISKIEATVGPTVTLYEIVPAEGVRIASIRNLEDDIALSLKALGIRIIAPIPGKGTVGIEVPNKDPQTVSMRAVLNSKKYQECKMALPMAMGATIANDIFIADLAKMPHLLVAGATGMGKSVGLNAIIASLLYKKHPSELKLVLIDPKMVEFSLYSKLDRHYLAKLPMEEDAIITDMGKVIQTLNSLCVEMDSRYELLRDANVRSLEEYNRKFSQGRLSTDDGHKYLPYIVVIVDEFADLIMTQGKEIETPIGRIAQKARAVGIHMILATQRPSTTVITGLIKANFPGRIAFRVIQMVDSRTILDCPGANQLIGRGDMLFSHNGSMERVQCAFISTEEVESLTNFIDSQVGYEHAYYLPECAPEEAEGSAIAGGSMERDSLFNDAARFVVNRQMGSTSSLQRQFGIGYNRAGKLMDQMEAAGIVGPVNGAKPRAILMDIITLESILGD